MLPRHSVRAFKAIEPTGNSSGNAHLKSSQLAEPLWIDPGLKSETGVRELISIEKKQKTAQSGIDFSKIFPLNPQMRG